jgi:hypothetical protein
MVGIVINYVPGVLIAIELVKTGVVYKIVLTRIVTIHVMEEIVIKSPLPEIML